MDITINNLQKKNKNDLEKYLSSEKTEILNSYKIYCDDKYYNDGISLLKDYQYDILKDILVKRNPEYNIKIGSSIREESIINRVKLPYWLGSMDKIKLDDKLALKKWLLLNINDEYIIEDKLDGVSCLVIINNGDIKIYTRGNGIIGADISYLAQYIDTIPKNISKKLSIRGELIIPIDIFNKKYIKTYANPRNMVAGIINSKKINLGINDIKFIAYEIIDLVEMDKPSIQLKYLSKIGFSIVNYEILKTFDIYNFIEILLKIKKNSIFEIDGLIIQSNKEYTRNIDGNPKYAFAFKMLIDDNIIETKVVDVIWNISKLGKIKPRIKIEPVHLQGVTITYATGFNARYVSNNKIGVDSIVKITRSGDVIPYIVEIVKQSFEGKMPTIPYKWNNTNVDIITDDFNDIKLITSFFEKLEIKYIGEKNVEKMYDYGLNDICKIISVSQETLYKIDGIGKKGAERIYTNIQNGIKHLKIQDVIAYSSILGGNIGIKKVNKLFDSIPNILEIYKQIDSTNLSDMINKIDGFSDKTTNIIIENIEKTDNFIKQLKQFVVFDNNELVCVHNEKNESYDEKKHKNINVVITGKRDHIKNNVEIFVKNGGKVDNSITKNTTYLVVGENPGPSKIDKANKIGIKIINIEDFITNYC